MTAPALDSRRCECGHGFSYHFVMVPVFGLPGPREARCMKCECEDRREAPQQLVMGRLGR